MPEPSTSAETQLRLCAIASTVVYRHPHCGSQSLGPHAWCFFLSHS